MTARPGEEHDVSPDAGSEAAAAPALNEAEQTRLDRALEEWSQVAREAPRQAMTVVRSAVLAAFLGGMLGVVAFAIEKALGLLSLAWEPWSWLVWALVPLYALVGGAVFVYYGIHRGWTRVSERLIFDSGLAERIIGAALDPLFRMLAEQKIEDLRAVQKRFDALCRKAVAESAGAADRAEGMGGLAAWIKRRFLRLMAPVLARVVRGAVDRGVTTVSALLDMRGHLVGLAADAGRQGLADARTRARNLALVVVLVACMIPPILIGFA